MENTDLLCFHNKCFIFQIFQWPPKRNRALKGGRNNTSISKYVMSTTNFPTEKFSVASHWLSDYTPDLTLNQRKAGKWELDTEAEVVKFNNFNNFPSTPSLSPSVSPSCCPRDCVPANLTPRTGSWFCSGCFLLCSLPSQLPVSGFGNFSNTNRLIARLYLGKPD